MKEDEMPEEPIRGEIILYQSEGSNVPVQVRYMDETLWMPQKEIAELFDTTQQNISLHLKNIYETGELDRESTYKKILLVRQEGSREVQREVGCYNLDAIIAVGYRVSSLRATRFRQWATATLREYITKGFVLNDDMLKNGQPFGKDYFDELLARIRDIRASERRFYQKVTDIFQECSFDYDRSSQIARDFYAACQNKLHYAVTGKTAAEIIMDRADASLPNMGLTNWKGGPDGRIHSSDVATAKNYLTQNEIERLNLVVSMLLDAVELRTRQGRLTSMQDCVDMLDRFIEFNGMELLEGKGQRNMAQAKKRAREQFAEFQRVQDCTYLNDFEREVRRIGALTATREQM